MSRTQAVEIWQLPARFAAAVSDMYGTEVPACTTLVDVSAAAGIVRSNLDAGATGRDLHNPYTPYEKAAS